METITQPATQPVTQPAFGRPMDDTELASFHGGCDVYVFVDECGNVIVVVVLC